jgi:hypothetical protein
MTRHTIEETIQHKTPKWNFERKGIYSTPNVQIFGAPWLYTKERFNIQRSINLSINPFDALKLDSASLFRSCTSVKLTIPISKSKGHPSSTVSVGRRIVSRVRGGRVVATPF